MLRGVSVTIVRPVAGAADRLGNATITGVEREVVDNVLVAPGDTTESDASRPNSVTAALTLHFPKSYAASLRGCEVELPAPWGGTYRVIGDPMPYMSENTPGQWNRPVSVEVAHG